MVSIKKFKTPEIKLTRTNNSNYSNSNSINNYVNNNIGSINSNNNINKDIDINNMQLDINLENGHSSSCYSDQEDILINGICSKITNDIQNKFADDDNDGSQVNFYPIFSKIVEGKKICDLVDENGCLKDINDILTNEEKEQLMKEEKITAEDLKQLNILLGDNLKIVDYPDKMGDKIMNCKINKVVHENSGFDAVVLEEANGNLMPIISGTNTSQLTDVFADLYPIINSDEQLNGFMQELEEILNFNLYDDKLKSLMNLKKEHDDIYWALVNIFSKMITQHPEYNINGFSVESLNWINDYFGWAGGDRDGVMYGIVELFAHLPDVLEVPIIGDKAAEFVLGLIGINKDSPNLLSAYGMGLGLTNRDMALIKKEGFLSYMEKCYKTQRNEAEILIKKTIEEAKEKGTKVDINGYSLGGGLALTSYANICLNNPSMEEYVNSVTAYDPAIIHTEREENGEDLVEYISKSDKTKLFIVSGDLTSTFNNSLEILDEQIFYLKPENNTILVNKINIEDSLINNPVFKGELSKILKNFNIEFNDDELEYAIKNLEPLREKYLYRENDEQYNKNVNFILNQVIFNLDSVEDIFFGRTHYMSSVDYSCTDENGNFMKEFDGKNITEVITGGNSQQNVDDGVGENFNNWSSGVSQRSEIPTNIHPY